MQPVFSSEKELWVDVYGYDGLYQVSTLGRVRSLPKIVDNNGSNVFLPGRILKKSLTKSGYHVVTMHKNGVQKVTTVHRLVLSNFIHNTQMKEQINHINGDKTDNRLVNLEWCTRSDNMKHAIKTGLAIAPFKYKQLFS